MSSSTLIRWGGFAAMGGGVLFLLYSLYGFAVGNGEATSPLVLLAILGYVLVGVGLVGFHTLQGGNYGRIGRAGLYMTIAAFLIWVILLLVGLLGGGGLEWLVPIAVLGTLVGGVLYGAATLQARVLPRWCGILFILLMPGTIIFGIFLPGDAAPILWVGLVWLALGYGLWSEREAPTDQSPRVR